ncbi:hypothetical protein LTR95_007379 [Oleoguttula sp. CCFEE 5521]
MSPSQGLSWPLSTPSGRLFEQRRPNPLSPFATLPVAFFAARLYAPPFATGYNVLRQVVNSSYQGGVLPGQATIENLKGGRVEEKHLKQMQVKGVQSKEVAQVKGTQLRKISEYADLSSWVHMWR